MSVFKAHGDEKMKIPLSKFDVTHLTHPHIYPTYTMTTSFISNQKSEKVEEP